MLRRDLFIAGGVVLLALISCQFPTTESTISSNANLSDLTVSTGTLTPAFSNSITSYTVDVGSSVASIIVTGTKVDANASISANSGLVQQLTVGANTVSLVVTAQDGQTTKTYVVAVERSGVVVTTHDRRDSTGALTDHWVYTYDSNGYLQDVKDYDASNVLKNTVQYSYRFGRRASTSIYSNDDVLMNYSGYVYDSAGILSRMNNYIVSSGVASTTLRSYIIYHFSGLKKTRLEYYSLSGTLTSSVTFTYDSTGMRTRSDTSDGTYFIWDFPSASMILATGYGNDGVVTSTRTVVLSDAIQKDNFLDFLNF